MKVELVRLWHAIDAELFKVLRRRMTYVRVAAVVLLVVLSYVLLWWGVRSGPGHHRNAYVDWLAMKTTMSFPSVVPYGLSLERFFATIACVIFAGSLMGNEFDWRTVGVFSARGVRRWHFIAAKVIVSAAFTFVVVTLGLAAAAAASAWFTHLYHLPYGHVNVAFGRAAVAGLARTSVVVLPLVLLALLAGAALRSAGQAVGAALGVYLTEAVFTALLTRAQGWVSHVPNALMNFNGDALMSYNGAFSSEGTGPFIFGSGSAPAWRAAAILGLWAIAFVAVALWRCQSRDIQE